MLQEIRNDNLHKIKEELKKTTTVLYGAANMGKLILSLCKRKDIRVDYFIDDDISKHGTKIEGILCLSFEELKKLSEKEAVSVIISNSYSKTIIEKTKGLPINLWECYSMYLDEYEYKDITSLKQSNMLWQKKYNQVNNMWRDEESKKIWKTLRDVVEGRIKLSNIPDISSAEEHYFVEPISELLDDSSVLVDCGANTGDILGQIIANDIKFNTIYLIEADPDIYDNLKANVDKLKLNNKAVPLHLALYDKKGSMKFQVGRENRALGHLLSESTWRGEKTIDVPVDTLDNIIDVDIDFLKTDIEGAEMPALRGGINLIKRSRPIFAVSIYHSFDDMVDIPCFMLENFAEYDFFLKNHSFTLAETVLYGIPHERLKH